MKNLSPLAFFALLFKSFKSGIRTSAKRCSNAVAKTRTFLWSDHSSRFLLFVHSRHNFFLGLLLSYGIISFIYNKVSTAEPMPYIKCPDGYAYEDSPGVYIRCEDWDQFAELYETKKPYKHLILKRSK